MTKCDRFENEALLLLEQGQPLDEHFSTCPDCLAARAAYDRLRNGLSHLGEEGEPAPGWQARVWDRIAATVGGDDPPVVRDVSRLQRPAGGAGAIRRSRRVWPWAAGLAAAGLVVGLLTGRAIWEEAAPPTTPVAQVDLDTLETQQRLGEATVVRTQSGVGLEVATTSALDAGDGYLEVWLINSDGKRMVSIGVLDADTGVFPISEDLLDEGYVIVDISREPFDDRPEHSGDSIVRGTLPA